MVKVIIIPCIQNYLKNNNNKYECNFQDIFLEYVYNKNTF